MKTIAISGHRELLNEKEVRNNIALSLQYFQTVDKELQAISALAAGTDTIFAQEAIRLNIPVRFVFPFDLEEYKNDFSSSQLLVLEDLITRNNHKYEVVSSFIANNPESRNEAYWAVGKFLVNNSDLLLAVWDGKDALGKGGTAEIVEYALNLTKEVHIINGLRTKIEPKKEDLLFENLDSTAIRYKVRVFQPAWYSGLTLAIIGVIFFAIGLAFHDEFISAESKLSIAFFEILSIIISAFLILVVARKYKNLFLENRRNAEYLRTLLSFKQANINLPKIKIEDIVENKKTKQSVIIQQDIIDFENNLVLYESKDTIFNDSKRKLWIFAQDQINYHEKTRLKPLKKKEENIHKILDVLKWVFYTSLGVKVIIEIQHFLHEKGSHLPHLPIDSLLSWLNLLLIVTPSIFAVLETVKAFEEWDRNKDESEKMIAKLEKVRTEICDAHTNEEIKQASKNLRIELEKENSEWTERVASLTPGVHI